MAQAQFDSNYLILIDHQAKYFYAYPLDQPTQRLLLWLCLDPQFHQLLQESQKIAYSYYGYAATYGRLGLSGYLLAQFHSIRSLDWQVGLSFLVHFGISFPPKVILNHKCPFPVQYSLSEFDASTQEMQFENSQMELFYHEYPVEVEAISHFASLVLLIFIATKNHTEQYSFSQSTSSFPKYSQILADNSFEVRV